MIFYYPEITQQTFVLIKTSWRHLEDVFCLWLQKTSSRHFQDVLIKTNIFVFVILLEDVFKTFSKPLQDVLLRRLQDFLQKRLQNVFKASVKTSSRLLQDVSKTFWSRLQDIFKTSWRVIRLNCLPSSRICLGHTSEKFMVSVENLHVW